MAVEKCPRALTRSLPLPCGAQSKISRTMRRAWSCPCLRDELFHPVGEEHGAHLVVVAHGAEGQNGGVDHHQVQLGALFLRLDGATHVHQQEHREFMFLLEHFDVGTLFGRSRSNRWFDFVARLVLRFSLKAMPRPLNAPCTARENAVAQAAGGNLHRTFFSIQTPPCWGRIRDST